MYSKTIGLKSALPYDVHNFSAEGFKAAVETILHLEDNPDELEIWLMAGVKNELLYLIIKSTKEFSTKDIDKAIFFYNTACITQLKAIYLPGVH